MTKTFIQDFFTSKTETLLMSSPNGLNGWSNNVVKHIPIQGEASNWRKVTWKGKTIECEYDMLTLMVQQWMKDGWTKEESLDLMFEIY